VKPSQAQRGVAECLGTAFLLAAVVGSGIMAARLAGGNGALALLCNTLPTGAILTVLILTLGPISGAHFNPAVTTAMALRGELGASSTTIYIGAQVIGGILGVWAAHVMFEPDVAGLGHGANGSRSMTCGSRRHVRVTVDDIGMRCANASGCTLCCWSLHHRRLLVYSLNLIRQSGCNDCALAIGYLRRHRAYWGHCLYLRSVRRHVSRSLPCTLVLAYTGSFLAQSTRTFGLALHNQIKQQRREVYHYFEIGCVGNFPEIPKREGTQFTSRTPRATRQGRARVRSTLTRGHPSSVHQINEKRRKQNREQRVRSVEAKDHRKQ